VLTAQQKGLPAAKRLIVIADNCTDTTAQVARTAGATVIERADPQHRGKGYALAFGIAHLQQNPPDCVIILDADCVPDGDALAMLARTAALRNRPVQARYDMIAAPGATPLVQVSNFAFLIKNFVRQRGMSNAGGPALLTGTGMAFPWRLIADAPLASGNIVEDLALGIHFAAIGAPPYFCEAARVSSAAADERDTLTQRRRWEHGFLATARTQAIPLIVAGVARRRWSLIWLGLHLFVPPLTLLALIGGLMLFVLVGLAMAGSGTGALLALTVLMGASAAITAIAWARFGRHLLTARATRQLPRYILWKIPVYLGFVRNQETSWVRTKRSGE
jgi:cellulose synthase/poly-beta-1,6-N-acetylglucosamine synthase-like glycosyltransferase